MIGTIEKVESVRAVIKVSRRCFRLQMLNSFASDLDSILSDLSTSPTLRGSHDELVPLEPSSPPRAARPASVCLPVGPSDVTDGPAAPSDISLLERLIRSHPVWYLPGVQRLAAAQLLQNQEQGVTQFIPHETIESFNCANV